jgi:ribosome-associated protein
MAKGISGSRRLTAADLVANGDPAEAPRKADSASVELVQHIAAVLVDNKALDVVALDVTGRCSYTDCMVICSGRSDRQVEAIAQNLQRDMRRHHGRSPAGVEGLDAASCHWALLDYGDVVVHVFYEPLRVFYDLEGLWGEAPRIEIPDTE